MLNNRLTFKAFIRQCQNSLVNIASRSLMIYLGSPWCATTLLNKEVATLAAMVKLRGTKLHIFENLSRTVITVEQPSSSGMSVMKSMWTVCYRVSGHGEANINQQAFKCQA